MSLPGSILMIAGDHHLYLDKVFDYFGYDVIDNERSVKSWQDALDVLSNWMISQTQVLKAVCIHQGWTIILDPELVMYDDEEVCGEINRLFQRKVFGLVYQEETSTYGFAYYDNKRIRRLISMDGKVVEDIGDRLQAEKGLNEVLSASDVIRVMSGIGVDYHSLKDVKHFVIFELEFRDDDTSDLDL